MIFKSTKGEGGAPELITLQDIFVFVLRQNRWYLCEVIMGYEFLRADVSKYRPEVYKTEESKILKKNSQSSTR